MCSQCLNRIHLLGRDVRVSIRSYSEKIFAVAAFDGPWLELVHKFKYEKSTAAIRPIVKLLSSCLGSISGFDCIVPVPLHPFRYLKRGFNQAATIANTVSKFSGVPVCRRVVKRCRNAPSQVGRSYSDRRDNVKSTYSPVSFFRQSVRGRRVLLVDDVVTSGATVDECAKVLVRLGAKGVHVLTLAKTL